MSESILTISELTKAIQSLLEKKFENIEVVGEISNFKAYASGHWYFSLKDAGAQIACTMWSKLNNYVRFTPQDGMKIYVQGRISVYPPRGNYQIDVQSMRVAGEGELQAAFEKLKKRLFDEGLFDDKHKKEIPMMPERIGIITSKDGAAIRDMISAAQRRFPLTELFIAPAQVQGVGAAESVVESLRLLHTIENLDVIIIARGGGSIEDLWAFNEEIVAREIYASKIPVVTGIGHEVDFTIADFVADKRASTPTAAMELITPNQIKLKAYFSSQLEDMTLLMEDRVNKRRRDVQIVLSSPLFRYPERMIASRSQNIDLLISRLSDTAEILLKNKRHGIELLRAKLAPFNIKETQKKGFVLVRQEGKFVSLCKNFLPEKDFELDFYDSPITISKNEEK